MIYKKETYDIIGAAMDVHRTLGSGFLESIYQEALEIELKFRNIPHVSQQPIEIWYKTQYLTKYFIADLLCYNQIIVELKAVSNITSVHEAQIINYLKATKKELGIIINFGTDCLEYKRYLNTNKT
ncbi:MAG: GxxExxY protein [Paludibacter sp.]|nr:GxxExxY protein [Paludibacter sp.]